MNVKNLIFTIVLLAGINQLYSQNRWLKVYHDEIDAPVEWIIETYDYGYFLLGRHGPNYPKYMWLIKTDINGEVLWEKTIGDGSATIFLTEVAENPNGDIYLVGASDFYDNYIDPIIIKLDSCGNKHWCKVFSTPNNNYDFAQCIALAKDGGIAVTLNLTGDPSLEDRICLIRLNSGGEVLWTQCYNSQDSCLQNEDDHDLILTPDEGFLITGFTYYEDPTHPNLYWAHPYFIKVDSLGNFQWETIVHKDDPLIGGQAWATVISPDSLYYYSSISHYYHEDNTSSPALLKIDMDGSVVDIYDLASGYEIGKLFRAVFISDSTLAGSAAWGNQEDDPPTKAIIIDALGNLKSSINLTEDKYLSYIVRSFDDKLLYFTEVRTEDHFDALLFKFNFNLEDDTIYTYPYVYDSLCPYPIASDTIVQDDCGLIVGITEWPAINAKTNTTDALQVFPNPATDQINCQLSTVNCQCSILIYDLYGRKVEKIEIPEEKKEIKINVSSYPPGIYIAVLRDAKGMIGRKKFVVARP